MNKIYLIGAILFLSFQTIQAHDELPKRAKKFSLGFQLNNYQQDFGLGIQLTSHRILAEGMLL